MISLTVRPKAVANILESTKIRTATEVAFASVPYQFM